MARKLKRDLISPLSRRRLSRWGTLFFIYTIVTIFFTLVSYAVIGLLAGREYNLKDAIRWHGTRLYLWAALSPIVIKLVRRHPIDRLNWARPVLFHFLAAMVWSLVHVSVNLPLFWFMVSTKNKSIFPPFSFGVQSVGETFMLGVIVYWIVLAVTCGIDYYDRYQKEELRASRLETELAKAQLAALKMQLQPHFIFNTLHSLTDLVLEDAEAATRLIARLGDFLRLTLESSEAQIIPLQRELEFLECYLEIEQVRFQDQLGVEITVDPAAAAAQVPNLILQPLVENAIRHGIAGRIGAGRIGVSIQRHDAQLVITISDDGPGPGNGPQTVGTGLGLGNTRERIRYLYGERSSFELSNNPSGGAIATLILPFSAPETSRARSDD